MKKLSPILAGVAGEYLVAGELSKRGYIASITLRNTAGVDILCSNQDATKTLGIQVKTNSGSSRSWILNKKAETYAEDNLFYVFVCLHHGKKPPDYFIVPSKIVAKYVKESHDQWLKTPGKKGQMHRDTSMRKFEDREGKFLNRWDLLGLNR